MDARRGGLGCGSLLALATALAWLTSSGKPSKDHLAQARQAEEQQQREHAAAVASVQAAADEQGRKNEEERRAYATAHDPAQRKAALEKLWSKAAAMTVEQREALLRDRCGTAIDTCADDERDVIIGAADNDAERRKLKSIAKALADGLAAAKRRAATLTAKMGVEARERFAIIVDTALLETRRNPDSVRADGPEKRTLHISGWFCSRQFMYDFTSGTSGAQARDVGFNKLQCEDSVEVWTWDL